MKCKEKLEIFAKNDTNPANYDNRYDVTILVNGLPLVHVELKRRGVDIREAFNQIDRYRRDSFGVDVVFTSMCRYLLYQMVHIQNIIPTQQEIHI